MESSDPTFRRPLVIGIAGGSGCGKTHLAMKLRELVGERHVAVLSMDQYFRTEVAEDAAHINFDHPAHLDLELMTYHLRALRNGESVQVPRYDFRTMRQTPDATTIDPHPVILVEGLFVLARPIVELFDLTCYLDVDADQRLLGRILRDIEERNASIDRTIDRYQRFVRPSYYVFVAPTKQNADIVVDFTYRRAFFTKSLAAVIGQFVAGKLDIDSFIAFIRGESYSLGYRPQDAVMPISVDIRDLAKAFPEHTEPEGAPIEPAQRPRLFLADRSGDSA